MNCIFLALLWMRNAALTWRQSSDIITGSWEIMLLLCKGRHDLGVFTALHQFHMAPGVVSLERTGILGNTCWKGSASLACKGSKRPLWKVQVPLSSLCFQLF